MSVILWAIRALVAGLGLIAVSARRALRLPPRPDLPPGEDLPPTVLQRLARRSLVVGLFLISLAVAAVLRAGADTFYENDATRLTVTLLMLAALMVLAGFGMRADTGREETIQAYDEQVCVFSQISPPPYGQKIMQPSASARLPTAPGGDSTRMTPRMCRRRLVAPASRALVAVALS